jgi:hypothetical protein
MTSSEWYGALANGSRHETIEECVIQSEQPKKRWAISCLRFRIWLQKR